MSWLLAAPSAWAADAGDAPVESRFGRVHFPISATPAAQAQFERAVAMLHSFWYEELGREFGRTVNGAVSGDRTSGPADPSPA